MPINIPADLPAKILLEQEKIFVMSEDRASTQDIRPLAIAIVNLMPTKIATEAQILRMLGNSPIQVDITLIKAANHVSRNTSQEHLARFYKTFSQVKNRKFDGMIITGAPVEQIPFEEVDYWDDLREIMEYSLTNVFSTLHICWGAQAGLYHHFGIQKHSLPSKLFGVFEHVASDKQKRLFRGFDDVFCIPHSRHTQNYKEDIIANPELKVLAESPEAGASIIGCSKHRQVFVSGHFEYDADTLAQEYLRDKDKGLDIAVPKNYFVNDDPNQGIQVKWRSHATLFFNNWLNFYVYQDTPFELDAIGKENTVVGLDPSEIGLSYI